MARVQGTIHLSVSDGCAMVRVLGELDMAIATELMGSLLLVVSARVDDIVIDLRGVEFMDSSGLHAILSFQQEAQEQAISVRFVQGPSNVQRVFDVAGVTDRLGWTSMGVLRAVSE
jgi:anti-sigma B factor antagonist